MGREGLLEQGDGNIDWILRIPSELTITAMKSQHRLRCHPAPVHPSLSTAINLEKF